MLATAQQSDVAYEYVGQKDPVHGPTDLAVVTARLPALLGRVHWQDHLSHADMHGALRSLQECMT
jgi:hypothetical protein